MSQSIIDVARAYYYAMGSKNLQAVEKCIDSNIAFIAPLAKICGKKEFLLAAEKFFHGFDTLTIRAQFSSNQQAVIVYDLKCPEFIENISAVALLNIENGLIQRIELFYDPRSFV